MKDEYRIERISRNNLNDLVCLHNIVHNDKKDFNYFVNLFSTEKFGSVFVGFVAYDSNNMVVANYSVLPVKLIQNNEITLAGQASSAMTHPNHRNKGLFILLANKTHELCKEFGIKILFAFPNNNSQHGFEKLHWSAQCLIKYATIDTTPSLLMKIFRKVTPFLHSKFAQRKILNHQTNTLATECIKQKYKNGIYRDESYLKYKLNMGLILLELNAAYALLHSNEYNIFLCDFYLKKNKNEESFWSELISFSKKAGFYRIVFHFSENASSAFTFPDHTLFKNGAKLMFYKTDNKIEYHNVCVTGLDYDTF